MINDNFYSIKSKKTKDKNNYTYSISFNEKHRIFLSHFPNNPIVPGACIIEIIRELTSQTLNKTLYINLIKNVKFLNVIVPNSNKEIILETSIAENNNTFSLTAILHSKSTTYSKLSLQLTDNL